MLIAAWALLFICFLALLHTYLLFPMIAKAKAGKSRPQGAIYAPNDTELPFISIVSSFFNEELVALDKIDSIRKQAYPKHKFHCFIGSDASSDQTNDLVQSAIQGDQQFTFFPFEQRRGKPPVINEIVERAIALHGDGPDHLILLTDANVMMHPQVLYRLARHFKNSAITLVDAHMQHTGMQAQGISQAENQYLSTEVKLKDWESRAWQHMMGPFGGCYLLRANYFAPVPANYLVDDFYIAMKVFEQGGKAINDLEAHCYEGVSHEIKEEYRRKRRISAGNFQNLFTFWKLWWPPFQLKKWIFFSHKVLRWFGPFLMLGVLVSTSILATTNNLLGDLLFLFVIIGMLGIPILDWLLEKFGLNLYIFRGLRYFMLMNLALLEGFFKYLKGIKSNVWQPTKRN